MITRREFAGTADAGSFLKPPIVREREPECVGIEVNDMQSQLNATIVNRIVKPRTLDELHDALSFARSEDRSVCVCGGRHSMGGQQFAADSVLIDMADFRRVIHFDRQAGHIEVQGGIEWPELIDYLHHEQAQDISPWAIREKQTGVDRVSLAGSLSSNVHGRGLRHPPIICDVESFVLIDTDGRAISCSRRENSELFSLAIGGYGLFGIIAHVTLRLVRRTKVQRTVDIVNVKELIPWIDRRLSEGYDFGDCQYSIDLSGPAGAHQGVVSCYRPIDCKTPIPADQKQLSGDDWAHLYVLARTDKHRAFETYSNFYRSTNGQIYWSDTHQLAGSFDGYRQAVDISRGTEVITEVYVSRENFMPLMRKARQDFIEHNVDVSYGTIRFIEQDTESFLAWAREPSVCIICNLHVLHTPEGQAKAACDFRRIIDRAIEHGGRYYLTYHRHATRKQVEACYPMFVDFLRLKRKYDPRERFQSEWYRHYKRMFADRA